MGASEQAASGFACCVDGSFSGRAHEVLAAICSAISHTSCGIGVCVPPAFHSDHHPCCFNLFHVATPQTKRARQDLAVVESGERLIVGQVKKLAKDDDESQPEQKVAIGGMAGLRRAAEAKMKDELTFFTELSKRILREVEQVAELLARGKFVPKKALADVVW